MFKSIMFSIIFFNFFLNAGEIKQQYAKITTPHDETKTIEKLKNISVTANVPVINGNGKYEIGRTWYDYAWNQQSGRTMAHDSQGGIHFAFMKRQPDATGNRYVTYDYWNDSLGLFNGNQSITVNQPTGWGRVVNGKFDEALISYHGGGIWLWQGPPISNFIQLFDGPGVYSGIARKGDSVISIFKTSNQSFNASDTVLVSTDYLQTWMGHNIYIIDSLTTDGLGEYWPTINPLNTMEFSFLATSDVFSGAPDGSVWLITSPDLGQTYSALMISKDDSTYGNSQYIIENFGQMNGMYSQDGNYHAVFGSVQGIADTSTSTMIDMFPILYWNKNDKQFIILTDDLHTSPPDSTVRGNILNMRPGNGLGNAYPNLSEGPNGELVVIWQQWEWDGTNMVTVIPSGGSEVYCTDIWGAYSSDGGQTWGDPFFVAGITGQSDVFPNITNDFFWNGTNDSIYLDIMYLYDTNAGVSLFAGGNDASESIYYYERVAIPETDLTGIETKQKTVLNKFTLNQNYPNPFNPVTNISYQLPKAMDVKLTIFNIVGQKVRSLLNKKQASGTHKIKWDGKNELGNNLASGVYLYQIKAGDLSTGTGHVFVQTKKMLLIR